jgi:GntR family transcriptional regulator/MocR family aminotransferase
MEDPGYPGALHTFKAAGAEIIPVDVDENGAVVPPEDCPAKLAFLTPSHQYPLGVTMTVERRQAWIDWAERHDAWIVEDDFDSEYRYSGTPQPAMQGLSRSNRVIYAGTFSKTLFPSLRIGFLVLPQELVGPFRRARAAIDGFPAILEQAVLADFIEEGHFGRHVRRMRTIYEERRNVMVESVRRHLSGRMEIGTCDSGMHAVGWLADDRSEEAVCAAAASVGVHMRPLNTCCVRPYGRRGVLLGFATTTTNDIREAVRKLASVLRSEKSHPGVWDEAAAERAWAVGGD